MAWHLWSVVPIEGSILSLMFLLPFTSLLRILSCVGTCAIGIEEPLISTANDHRGVMASYIKYGLLASSFQFLCVCVLFRSSTSGGNIAVWDWTDGNNQKFYADAVSGTTGWYTLRPAHATNMCITSDGIDNYANVIIATCDGGEDQHWAFHT